MRACGGRGRLLLPALAAVLAGLLASAGGSSAAPRFVVVFRIAPPHASTTRALALARSLDFEGPAVRDSPSSYIVGDRTGTRTLVLFKASGGFDYVSRAAYQQPPAGQLPTADQARRLAIQFLGMHRLLPAGNARVEVHPDSHSAREPAAAAQQVTVFIVRHRPTEGSPASVESLVDGEPIRQDEEHGYDLVLWHRSSASSTQCYPSGGVDNTDRPCRVFPQALFFTPG